MIDQKFVLFTKARMQAESWERHIFSNDVWTF